MGSPQQRTAAPAESTQPQIASERPKGILPAREDKSGIDQTCELVMSDGQTGLRTESCRNDCLTRRKSIRPCVPSHIAYEVGAARQQTVRSPRTFAKKLALPIVVRLNLLVSGVGQRQVQPALPPASDPDITQYSEQPGATVRRRVEA
jgi:hypothetical protein